MAEDKHTEDTQLSELEKIRAEMAEIRAANASLKEELTRARQPADASLPTTAEGWHYAIQSAQLRAEQNEELRAYLPELMARYNQWAQQEQGRQQARQRDLGRLESELSRLGVSPESKQARAAQQLVQSGLSYDDVAEAYLDLIKSEKVEEANKDARSKQGKAATRGAIEGGEVRGTPPNESTESESPDDQFMRALVEGVRRRAPASVKLRRERTQ